MKPPKKMKKFGYPPKWYRFTGEYSELIQGYYKAKRNQRIVYAPIYKNQMGHRILDMGNVVTKKM